MGTPVTIYDANGKAITTLPSMRTNLPILATNTEAATYGHFKAQKVLASDGAPQSIEFIAPIPGGSLCLVDLLVSFEKKTSSEISIVFHDATNTELIWFGDLQDAPIFFGITFGSRWQGWENAHINIDVAGAGADGSVAIGYQHMAQDITLPYARWNSER